MNLTRIHDTCRRRFYCRLLLYSALALLVLGLFLPFMTVRRFTDDGEELPGFDGMMQTAAQKVIELFVDDTPVSKSVVGGIATLWTKQCFAVALLILFVSIVFPIGKLVTSIVLVDRVGHISGSLRWFLERFGPWSLLDATLVALLVIASQGFPLGTVIEPSSGFYVFSTAIVLSYLGVLLSPGHEPEATSTPSLEPTKNPDEQSDAHGAAGREFPDGTSVAAAR